MKNKISILMIAVILTIILFAVSTYMQRKIINYEPTIMCYVASQDIADGEKISEEKMKQVSIPIPIIINMQIIQDPKEIEELYKNI